MTSFSAARATIACLAMPIPTSPVPSGLGGRCIPDRGIGEFASGGDDYLDGGEGNDTLVGDAFSFGTVLPQPGRRPPAAAAVPTPFWAAAATIPHR